MMKNLNKCSSVRFQRVLHRKNFGEGRTAPGLKGRVTDDELRKSVHCHTQRNGVSFLSLNEYSIVRILESNELYLLSSEKLQPTSFGNLFTFANEGTAFHAVVALSGERGAMEAAPGSLKECDLARREHISFMTASKQTQTGSEQFIAAASEPRAPGSGTKKDDSTTRIKQFCVFCDTAISNLSRHLLAKHASEERVKPLSTLAPKDPFRRRILKCGAGFVKSTLHRHFAKCTGRAPPKNLLTIATGKELISDNTDSRRDEPKTSLWFDISDRQWPVVYSKHYNVKFGGLEKLHPFDANKWANIFQFLREEGLLTEETVVTPREASESDLLLVHSINYLNSLKWGYNVAAIAEIPCLVFVPNFLIQRLYLRPMRLQTGGSILAGRLALDRGWAINIGGGFHHCSSGKGGGFCAYADITLLIQYLFKYEHSRVKKAMIVDLDAHQGNGHENDFLGKESQVFILDVYNDSIYPRDHRAEAAISRKVKLKCFTTDAEYLPLVSRNLEKSLATFHPDIIVYNAGTDILEGDSLGLLSVSALGIIERDELVFKKARELKIPIVMLTSGGYLKKTARIIADSILNLHEHGLITQPQIRPQ